MTNNEFFNQLLGLTPPWRVSNVSANLDQGVVHVYVEHDASLGRLCCSTCGRECPGYDTQEQRYWRHLDLFQYTTYLVCSLPRIECPVDGVRPAHAPWTESGSRFTLMFEHWAIAVLLATGVQHRAAQLLRLSPGQVYRIMHRAVSRGLARRDPNAPIRHAWLDEKSIGTGHQYATVLGNASAGYIIDMIESRTSAATKTLLKGSLSKAQRRQIECVSMDMWRPFASAVKAVLPKADIAHDRFHVAGYLTKAVDDTRKAEHARLAKQGASPLKNSKYLWLINEDKLADEHKAFLDALARQALETPKVWALKEAFREFFNAKTVKQAMAFFENWYDAAIQTANKYLIKVADMLKKHLMGLTAYIKHKATNAIAEAMNANIQLVKAKARGYRTFHNFRIAVLFFHGKLRLNP